MKRFLILSLVLLACLLVTGCDILFELAFGHDCAYTEWEVAKEATCLENGREERYCVICYEEESREIKKLNHTPVEHNGVEPTCTDKGTTPGQYCSSCMHILSGIKDIEPLGHSEVIDPAVPVTEEAPGRTEGKHCSTCGEVFIKQMSVFSGNYSQPEKYHDDYAYKSLLKLENGENLVAFYDEIDRASADFHSSLVDAQVKKNGLNDIYYAAEIYFSDNCISKTDAVTVWCAYMKDHPLYYWMSSSITYTDEYITLAVDEEYIDGETREMINADLYKAVEEYVLALDGEGSPYGIALGFHDRIIMNADYAYEDDGTTPSYQNPAHNILGVLFYGEGVCESYAKAFQLLLNYCNIDNIYVTGYSGEAHAWNMIRLDDGRWYWCDLTWDDQPEWMLGVRHNYFCVTDDTLVNWSDGSTDRDTMFTEDHIPDAAGGEGAYYSYDLPERADSPYNYDGLMLRDKIIEANGLSYVLIGFKTLSLIDIRTEGKITIPDKVSYKGDTYRVACIGKYDEENRILHSGSVIEYDHDEKKHINVTFIEIPSSIEFIWDFAFDNCNTITGYHVSEDNKTFASYNGALFTKNLYTLIKFPLAMNIGSYTVPEQTVEIAFGAFGDGGNVFCPKHLTTLNIPATVKVIGAGNGGKGFRDGIPEDPSDVITLSGYVTRLYTMFGLGLNIEK